MFLGGLLLLIFFRSVDVSGVRVLRVLAVAFYISMRVVAARRFIEALSKVASLHVFYYYIASGYGCGHQYVSGQLLRVMRCVECGVGRLLQDGSASKRFSSGGLYYLLYGGEFVGSFLFVAAKVYLLYIERYGCVKEVGSAERR